MQRFFFNLCGKRNVQDCLGLRFETDLLAFRAAERFAEDVSAARPLLRRNAWIALTREGLDESYCVAIDEMKSG